MILHLVALALVLLLIVYLSVEIHLCRRRVEPFSQSKPLASSACDALLLPIAPQNKLQQKYRQRFLKATAESHPNLDHTQHQYCYVRDFDHNTAAEYAPTCDKVSTPLYNNPMIASVFLSDIRDKDSELNVPRRVCMMQLDSAKANISNINDFLRDMNYIENAEFMQDVDAQKTEIAVLRKNNLELSGAIAEISSKLSDTQQAANKDATMAKETKLELQILQLQQQSDTQNKVIMLDEHGSIISESNSPTSFDMTSFKGQIRSIVLPKQGSFRVILYGPRGEFAYSKTDWNTSDAGLQVRKVSVV